MKLNRSVLRKMILSEIKSLQEDKAYGDRVYSVVVNIAGKKLRYFKDEDPKVLTVEYKFNDGKAEIQEVKDQNKNKYTDDFFVNQLFRGRLPFKAEMEKTIIDAVVADVPKNFKGTNITEKEVKFKFGF